MSASSQHTCTQCAHTHANTYAYQQRHMQKLNETQKKFKDKAFAAGCSRDVIRKGAEMLGWELDDLIRKTIEAMKEDPRN